MSKTALLKTCFDVMHFTGAANVLRPFFAGQGVIFCLHHVCPGGGTQRWFDRESPWIQYVSQSSYWVFLVHMPLVCLAGWWLVQYDFPSPLKFLLVCGFTAVVAFLTFHYWVQKTWLSDFLHGRRFDLKWPWLQAR